MSETESHEAPESPEAPEVEVPEVIEAAQPDEQGNLPPGSVSEPAKVMRIGAMIRQLLEEVRSTDLDEAGRSRLREIYDTSVSQLAETLSPDLQEELASLAMPFGDDDLPSESELRIAQAQLVGWLEGLFHGIQATLFAQQMAARQQLEQMKQTQALPPGGPGGPGSVPQTGVYL